MIARYKPTQLDIKVTANTTKSPSAMTHRFITF
jgi:hypothetical protein